MVCCEKPDNLVDLLEASVARYPDNRLLGTRNAAGDHEWATYARIGRRVDDLRAGLKRLGVGRDDAVGFIGGNSVEWVLAAFATYGLGARFVPMYAAELARVWKYVIRDSGARVVIVLRPEVQERIMRFKAEIPTLEHVIVASGEAANSLAGLEAMGREKPVSACRPQPDEIATLIYTAGTTGDPKGVLLTHGNLTSSAGAVRRCYPELDENSRSLSILPWAHVYGQTAELYNFMQVGGSIGLTESFATIAGDMRRIRPTHLIALPQVFNRIHDGLWNRVAAEGGLRQRLFCGAVETARQRRRLAEAGRSSAWLNLRFAIYDRLVFSKIRAKFGGCLTGALTAGAPMNSEICRFFHDIGIPVMDCYGLTETALTIAMNCREHFRIGSVGRPVEGVRVVIDHAMAGGEEGEIVVYGPNVMRGYHNKPEETRAVLTPDGGFRTGDLGRLDADGYLYITGRRGEQYRLENGKYVFPAGMEEEIRQAPSVANAMVYGEGRPFNVCLVVPDFLVLGKYALEHGLPNDPEILARDEGVRRMITAEIVRRLQGRYGTHELPRRFGFIAEDFSLAAGTLTQTLKLKRHVVQKKYHDLIEGLYRG